MRKGAEKLTKFGNAKQQGRLDGFFTAGAAKAKAPAAKKGEDKAEIPREKLITANLQYARELEQIV